MIGKNLRKMVNVNALTVLYVKKENIYPAYVSDIIQVAKSKSFF